MKNTSLKTSGTTNHGFESQLKKKVLTAISHAESPYIVEEIFTEEFNVEKEQQRMNVRLKKSTLSKLSPISNRNAAIKNNTHSKSLSVSMVYQNKPIGEIEITLSDQGMDIDKIRSLFEHIAMDIALFIKRHQAHHLIAQSKQLDLQWIGNSDSLKNVERFIEKVSCVDFPVLIQGKSGSGKLLTAYSIHCHSPRKKMPFIESHCLDWDQKKTTKTLKNLLSKAAGGTLFLRGIDSLPADEISKIRHSCRHLFNTNKKTKQLCSPSVRLITSTSNTDTPKRQQVWQELDYLSIQLPDLCDRRDDIKALISHYLHKLSYIKNIQLAPECWNLFEQFRWEGNVKQLERIVSKLVVMSESNYLNPSALLAIIPQLEDEQGCEIDLVSNTTKETNHKSDIDEISYKIATEKYAGEVNQHPALTKAIEHLAQNYSNDISLNELASIAFVSPSHLSYLFKHHLNSTFKKLLIQIRIEKAKLLLLEDKHCRITEIAFDVGFHDLSHFEKTFKKLVGNCPGKYRKTTNNGNPTHTINMNTEKPIFTQKNQ